MQLSSRQFSDASFSRYNNRYEYEKYYIYINKIQYNMSYRRMCVMVFIIFFLVTFIDSVTRRRPPVARNFMCIRFRSVVKIPTDANVVHLWFETRSSPSRTIISLRSTERTFVARENAFDARYRLFIVLLDGRNERTAVYGVYKCCTIKRAQKKKKKPQHVTIVLCTRVRLPVHHSCEVRLSREPVTLTVHEINVIHVTSTEEVYVFFLTCTLRSGKTVSRRSEIQNVQQYPEVGLGIFTLGWNGKTTP
jgi:hypothetical protein